MEGPGQLKHNGRGELVIGAMTAAGTPAPSQAQVAHHQTLLQDIATLFASAGVPCEISDRVKDALWFKFLINCVVNAVSAIGQIEYGRMVQVPEIRRLLSQLTTEFLAVAQAEGVHFDRADVDDKFEGLYVSMAGQRSSTAQDIGRGKRTEIDHLNGLLSRLGDQHGIPTPTHQAMLALVKLLEYNQHSKA
jgi:2-dehydropantoate 2-reductase